MKTKARSAVTYGVMGTALLGGFYLACIIPDEGIVVNQDCGEEWRGVATNARGLNADDDPVDILLQPSSTFPEGSACLNPTEVAQVEAGLELDCHLEDDQTDCEAVTGCEWQSFSAGARSVDICWPDNTQYQTVFQEIVESTIARCEDTAEDNTIDPYPCEEHGNQTDCENAANCEWSTAESPSCSIVGETCTTAAAKAGLFDPGLNPCFIPNEECVGGTGGGDGGSDGADESTSTGEEGLPDPGPFIANVGGNRWEVDTGYFDLVMADPALLLQDDARFEMATGGGWLLQDVVVGSVAHALGFQDDDKIVQLNGYGLWTLELTLAAGQATWGATTFDVKLKRGGTFHHFYYDLI